MNQDTSQSTCFQESPSSISDQWNVLFQENKTKQKNNVTERYHSTFILGQVGIIIQNKVEQNKKNQEISLGQFLSSVGYLPE